METRTCAEAYIGTWRTANQIAEQPLVSQRTHSGDEIGVFTAR